MTPEKKSLDRLLHVVRDNPPVAPLLGDDEIEKILGGASAPGASRPIDDHTPNRRFLMGASAFLMLAAAGTIMMIDGNDPVTPGSEPRPASALSHAIPGGSSAPQLRPDTPSTATAPADPESGEITVESNAGSPQTDPSPGTTFIKQERIVTRTTKGSGDTAGGPRFRIRKMRAVDGAGKSNSPDSETTIRDEERREPVQISFNKNPMLPYRLTVIMSDDVDMRHNPEKDIAGIRYIELTTEELKKLGVHRNNGALELYGEEKREIGEWVRAGKLAGYDTTRPEAIVRFRTVIDSGLSKIEPVPNPTPESYSPVAPIVVECQGITSGQGRFSPMSYRAMVYFNRSPLLSGNGGGLSDEEMDLLAGDPSDSRSIDERTASPSLGRLVAVHVLPENGKEGRTADVHLWYLPTAEFIDRLPDRYRDALRKEVETIAAVEREKLPPGVACERLTGEQTFLDICRAAGSSGGALRDGSLIHNADKSITVQFRTTEMRTVSIALHDMSGRFIKTLSDFGQTAGDNRVSVDIGDVAVGTYLVVIRSEQGEQLVQRLIVR